MVDTEQIFQAIQSLPADARRMLIERVARELTEMPSERARPPVDPFLGLLADEPGVADEILEIATRGRHEGRDVFDDHEDPS